MSLKEIRGRIASVKNTQQITKAMKMVSAAKLRRAQDNIINLRPYAKGVLGLIADIAATHRVNHPLLHLKTNPQKILVVVITSDRGLCGSFNASVSKYVENYYKENKDKYEQLDFLYVGRKGFDYLKNRGFPKPVDVILNLAREISYTLAANVAERLMTAFTSGGYDEVRFVYNEFKSAISQNRETETLLPIDMSQSSLINQNEQKFSKDLIFEPSPEEIVEDLLHKHFAVQVYRIMCESVAGEHAARMTAMENATNNAVEMVNNLTLKYNKLRQAAITTELMEISSGAEALKG
ncbi:MAG: ATP synthase F1 subunit gamma [Bdellovibrionaceae bacterium]|nr:ATP synthase F1 subunit gamma [Pseudobdellovibrionaceae bacterium]